MALISCKECGQTVGTGASVCPDCGAPQQQPAPPLLPIQPKEETIYSDNAVIVTNMRVIIGGATYALRNVTSVRMLFTRPRQVKPILLFIVGLILLLAAFFPINEHAPAPGGVYVVAGMMIVGAVLWMVTAKTKYHVSLSSASGEIHALTSTNRAYIESVVLSINEAIVKLS